MSPRLLPLGIAGLVLSLSCIALWPAADTLQADILSAENGLQWYRGNMHTHSLWSDGDDFLESIADWYEQHGYHFLVFTDHNVLADKERWGDIDKIKNGRTAYEKLKQKFPDWVEERVVEGRTEVRFRTFVEVADRFNKPGKYLLIQGEEISDRFENLPIHINAHNVRELIVPRRGDSVREVIQNNVDAVISQRVRTGQPMFPHLNHPNFGYAITAEDLMPIVGEQFFEVYNGHPSVYNQGDDLHPSTERMWDIILTKRLAELELPPLYGLAVDDGHNYHNIPSRASEPGRGWVMVLTDALTPEKLIEALEAGRFYATSGITLSRVEASAQRLSVAVEARPDEAITIEFVGTRRGYSPESEPVLNPEGAPVHVTRKYDAAIGSVLKTVTGNSGTYEFTGDEIYVRARITSSMPHPNPSEPGEFQQAWVQPVIGRASKYRP
jgi:hypothetical protein